MKILILYPNSFPYSGAATNRIISIARGLVETKNDVEIIISRPTEKNSKSKNRSTKGIFKGIKYNYASNTLFWPSSKFGKLKSWLIGYFSTIKLIKKRNPNIVISAATSRFFENLIFKLICKNKNIKFLYTLDEYPWVILRKKKHNRFYRNFYLRFYYKIFDGFIIMTNKLIDYYKPLASKKAKFVHIPMSVELDRFDIKSKGNEYGCYLAYCGGDLSGDKDGVDILIKSFNKIKVRYPQLKLLIIGRVNKKIGELIEHLNLINRVLLLGFVHRDKIPDLLFNAIALCLSRPDNKQAEGGFPTKIGEYLASSRPIIVTDVGEIGFYLKDHVSAFIAKPDDIDNFALKIQECLDNPDKSTIIGKNGKEIAKKHFNFSKQGKKLSSFLNEML